MSVIPLNEIDNIAASARTGLEATADYSPNARSLMECVIQTVCQFLATRIL